MGIYVFSKDGVTHVYW